MKKIKTIGSPDRNYTKAEKFEALKRLQKFDFNMAKTSQQTGISVDNIRRWRHKYGDEVFSKEPRTDILQKKVDASTQREIKVIDIQTKIMTIATTALDEKGARLNDPERVVKISTSDLIAIAKLRNEINIIEPEKVDAFEFAMARIRTLRVQNKKDVLGHYES